MKNFQSRIALFVVALLSLASLKANASPLLTFSEKEVAGIYQYDFALTAEPGDFVFELYIDVSIPSSAIIDVFAPSGWGSVSDPFAPGLLAWGDNGLGGVFIDSVADFGSELLGPDSLVGFGFTSASMVTEPILFSVNFDPVMMAAERAASVPEPHMLVLVLTGLLLMRRVAKYGA